MNDIKEETINNNTDSSQLISLVKRICDKLRTVMEVNEYRNYVLGFLFFKYLSETIEKEMEPLLAKRNIKYKDLEETNPLYTEIQEYVVDSKIGFFIDYKYTYQGIMEEINQGKDILSLLEKSFSKIEESSVGHQSEDDFKGLFREVKLDDSKLGKIEEQREETIKFILKELSTLKLSFNNSQADIFGDAYEYLLSEFASDGGKKAGEFYTPSSIADLLTQIAAYNRENFSSAYDPACGSGSLLLKLTKKVNNYEKIYGQEIKSSTFNLARMNLFLRGMNYSNFDIKEGDTLLDPKHINKKFQCIVANPPFSLKWSPNDSLKQDERYNVFPAMAPKNKADFAFLQHMLHHVDEKEGIIVSIFSLGILERGNAEKKIREYIVEQNYIDSIILLPSRMFFNTSIPTCIVIARKNKKNDDNTLFIDASNEFIAGKRQNQLGKENIAKILEAWKNKKDIPHFAKMVSKKTIIDNDYSLSVSRYVEPKEDEQENIDIEVVKKELSKISEEIKELENKFWTNLEKYQKENQN